MSIKLTDKQLMMLSAAAQRDDRGLVAPAHVTGAGPQKAGGKLIAAGLVKEVKAKAGAPIWRRDVETGALIRAADRWRGLRFTEFELRQITAVRKELDQEYEASIMPLARSSQPRVSSKVRASTIPYCLLQTRPCRQAILLMCLSEIPFMRRNHLLQRY